MGRMISEAAQKAIIAIDELNTTVVTSNYTEFEAGIDDVAAKMKRDIVNADSIYDPSKKTFYISNTGNDDNDGTSPETAWKTLAKANDANNICEDCNILLERGGLWREPIRVPCNGVTYSAYGVGAKPRIYGSLRNYAKPEYWKKSEFENVWYTDLCTKNVGLVAINHSDVLGKYDEIMCVRHNLGRDGFEGPRDLKQDYDFYGHLDETKCYLYCSQGNPGEVYDSIELGESIHLVVPTAECRERITFDNLHLRYTGFHGIAGLGGRKKINVHNCIMAYLGGSILDGFAGVRTVGFGNAIEVYGGCDGYYVNANWIYQIYDTAITHQRSAGGQHDCHMNDVEYIGNLCEYCHWSIEFYNQPDGEAKRSMHNVDVHHNLLRCGGMGWGSRGRAKGAALFNSFTCPPDTVNFITHNNIYDRSAGGIVRLNRGGDENIRAFYNTYIQSRDGLLGWCFDGDKGFDNAPEQILTYCKEENARYIYAE